MDLRREALCHRCGTRLAHDHAGGYCSPCQAGSHDRFTVPPDVPTELWEGEVMREAFASRHMGRVIRAYRCHPFHGRRALPQDVVAGWMGITQGQLSRIENGPAIMHLDRLTHWARILRIPSSRLWFTLPEGDRAAGVRPAPIVVNDADVSRWWAPADTVEIVSKFTRKDLTLDRREAARMLAGSVIFGSALLEPLEFWLSGAMEKPRASRPGSVGYQEVEQIEKAAIIFRDWDDQFGGGLRRKAVVGQLNEVADLLRDSHPVEIQRRLYSAMAQLAETAAMMSWDSGHQALAQRYYVLALRAAKAGDRAFGANVMAAMARQLLYLGYTGDALELVRLALDNSAGYASASVRSMLYTREAWAYAKLGRISAFRWVTEKAEDALTEAKPAEDPYWITYFDAAELEGTTGGRLLELAHHDERLAAEAADHISQAVVLRRPVRLRSSALDQVGLAEARLIQGEMDEASRLGHQAAALVEQTPSDRVRVKLAELYQHTNAYAAIPVIASLRDHIRSLRAGRPV